MFDDVVVPKSGNTPPNLPLGEPEDMFEKTDSYQLPSSDTTPPQTSEESQGELPNALEAGVLKPKITANTGTMSGNSPSSVAASQKVATQPVSSQSYTIQTPSAPFLQEEQGGGIPQTPGSAPEEAPFSGRKILVFAIVLLVLFVVGAGSFWIYTSFIRKGTTGIFDSAGKTVVTTTNSVNTQNSQSPTTLPANTGGTTVTNTNSAENNLLFGEPVDTDSDGIPDTDESQYGTDNLNWDTDGDGVSDGDEILIWKTNPRMADTDSDGYSDSVEIKNGYNPSGEGKLFETPAATSTVTATGTVK